MKKKAIGITLAIVTLSMLLVIPKDIAAIPSSIMAHHATHNDVTIDGTIGNDWWDANFTETMDAYGDEAWGTDGKWGLNGLYTAINDTGIAIALNASLQESSNGFLVFMDTDKGAYGVTDQNTAGAWNRNAKFGNNFKTNMFLGSWGVSDWVLFNFTAEDGTTGGAAPPGQFDSGVQGFTSKTVNQTAAPTQGTSIVHYEAFVPWNLIYPAENTSHPVPANAEIRLAAAMFGGGGGDSPADLIPDSMNIEDPEEVTNYIGIKVDSNGDQLPNLDPQPTTVEWAGNQGEDSFGGYIPAGFVVEFKISVFWAGTSHDHPNVTDIAKLSMRQYDYSAGDTVSAWTNMSMVHKFGDYEGNNDWYRRAIKIDPAVYAENDTIEWFITTPYGTTSKSNITIGPLPPIDIEVISSIDPAGGFILPGDPIHISAAVGQLLNGTAGINGEQTFIHEAPGTEVTLYWVENDTGAWKTKPFTFRKALERADEFNVTIGPYMYPTNITFYINATNNNTVLTNNISIFVLVPPPEMTLFTMTDPEGDEYGVYPTDTSFAPYEGLLDILNFTVTYNVWVTTFWFKMKNNSNPWGGPKGFSHPTFMIMVDTETGGHTESFGNAYVNTDISWDHGFQVTSWEQWYWTDPAQDPQKSGTGIALNSDLNDVTETYWISFSVPTFLTGQATTDWKYVAMVGSNDFTNFRQHKAAAEQWAFGGGDDGDYDPNYVDLLVPAGGDSAWLQDYITDGYDVSAQKRTTVMAVGPTISFVPDTTDPTVDITSPTVEEFELEADATTVSITFEWTVSDPDEGTLSGLDKLEVFVDGVLQTDVSFGDTSLTVSLDVGEHTIRINAYDLSGNVGSAELTIEVKEKPGAAPGFGFEILGVLALLGLASVYLRRRR